MTMMNSQFAMNPARRDAIRESEQDLEDWYEQAMDNLDKQFMKSGMSPTEYDRQCRILLQEFNEGHAEIYSD